MSEGPPRAIAPPPTSRALFLLGAALLLGALAWAYLGALNSASPPARLPAKLLPVTQPAKLPEQAPRRVVMVVFDGLRCDVSRGMPFMNELRARGVDGRARAPLPSLSRPAYATLISGALPLRTGVRSNRFSGPVSVDSLLRRAQARRLKTTLAGNWPWWRENYGDGFDSSHLAPILPRPAVEAAVSSALASGADFVLVHLVDLDKIAHLEGVRGRYPARARSLDAGMRRALADLDLDRDVLVLTSDHGHLTRGGHGGPEPEVLEVPMVIAGRGVKHTGPLVLGSSGGIAPTLALLMGIEFPRDAELEPYWNVIDEAALGSGYLQARRDEFALHTGEYKRRLEHHLATTQSFSASLATNTTGRALRYGLACALIILLIGWGRREVAPGRRRALLLLPLFLIVAYGVYRAAGYPLSLSAVVTEARFLGILTAACCAGFGVHAAALWWALGPDSRNPSDYLRYLMLAALSTAALAPLLWLLSGFSHARDVPSPLLLFMPLPLAFAGAAFCILCGLLMLAMRVSNSSHRRRLAAYRC